MYSIQTILKESQKFIFFAFIILAPDIHNHHDHRHHDHHNHDHHCHPPPPHTQYPPLCDDASDEI